MRVLGEIAYTKLEEIGAGQGMNSEVYLINEPQLGGRMAVKEIPKTKFQNDPAVYFQEAHRLFQCADRNVVPIQYACEAGDNIALVMPYYSRGSLGRRISDRPLPLGELLRVAQGVLAGLARVHLTGYVHFDVRPSNVLFSDTDEPMLADFGQSRAIDSRGVVLVPAIYLNASPPETFVTGHVTVHADIYQMGLLLYRALNGDSFYQPPTDYDQLKKGVLAGKLPDRRRFMPHVPQRLRSIVRKAMRPSPGERFQSATDMADVLGRVPLVLDWSTAGLPDGGFRWRAKRNGRSSLVVELSAHGDTWCVETFTENGAQQRRAKDRAANWRRGLSLPDAHSHLTKVFGRLP